MHHVVLGNCLSRWWHRRRPRHHSHRFPAPAAAPVAASAAAPSGYFDAGDKQPIYSTPAGRVSLLQGPAGRAYRLGSAVRRGHFGKLRLAQDAHGEALAAKEFRLASRPPRRDDATRISHPHDIAFEVGQLRKLGGGLRVVDVIEASGKVYVLTNLFAGSWSELRAHVSPASLPPLLRHLGIQAAKVLQALHAKGYVHGDVKPDNFLFDARGQVALCDFGFAAKAARMAPRAGGTFAFMAPEFVASRARSPAYDIYSLGLSLADLVAYNRRPRAKDQATVCRYNAKLQQWRCSVLQKDQTVDMRRVGAQHCPLSSKASWDAFFEAFKRAEPHWCRFVIERMLHPDPQARPSATAVLNFARQRRAALGESWQSIGGLTQHAAACDTKQQQARAALVHTVVSPQP